MVLSIIPYSNFSAEGLRVTTGTTSVPGTGEEIDYSVSALRHPDDPNQILVTVSAINNGDKPITFVACAMIRIDSYPPDKMHQYVIDLKTNSTTGEKYYECKRDGVIKRPNSFHLGCKTVTIPADGKWHPVIYGAARLPVSFTDEQISSIYWDLLEDHPMDKMCQQIGGVNVNLSPASYTANWKNIWAKNLINPECLRTIEIPTQDDQSTRPRHCSATIQWDTGNWVTMTWDDKSYPSRLVGTISNSPPGGEFQLSLAGEIERNYVANDEGIVEIDESFTIQPHWMEFDTLTMRVDADPWLENPLIEFHGEVLGAVGNPFYEPGEFMYGIDLIFTEDHESPTIKEITVLANSTGFVNFEVTSSDETTIPTGAILKINSTYMNSKDIFLNLTSIDSNLNETKHEGVIGPFEDDTKINYQIIIVDEGGNTVSSEIKMMVVPEFSEFVFLIFSLSVVSVMVYSHFMKKSIIHV